MFTPGASEATLMDMGKLVVTKSNADLLFIRLLETNFSEIWMNMK